MNKVSSTNRQKSFFKRTEQTLELKTTVNGMKKCNRALLKLPGRIKNL